MPELPEVEVVRRGLEEHVVGRTISTVRVLHPRAVRRHEPGPEDLAARLLGREAELMTLIEGDGAPLAGDRVAGLAPEGIEVEYERGGQAAYWWLIAAE